MRAIELGLGVSQQRDTKAAVAEAVALAKAKLGAAPGLALVSATVERSATDFLAAVHQELPNVPISGITTSLGILGVDGITAGADGGSGRAFVCVAKRGRFLRCGWGRHQRECQSCRACGSERDRRETPGKTARRASADGFPRS